MLVTWEVTPPIASRSDVQPPEYRVRVHGVGELVVVGVEPSTGVVDELAGEGRGRACPLDEWNRMNKLTTRSTMTPGPLT